MYVHHSVRYSARRSLFGALIGALGGIDVSKVKYACIENVCVAFEIYIYMFVVHSGWDCTCRWILCYLSGLVVLETVKDRSIFRRQVAGHAH